MVHGDLGVLADRRERRVGGVSPLRPFCGGGVSHPPAPPRGELFTPLQPDPVTLSAALVSLVPVAVCVILICAIASYESAKPWHYVFWFGMVALGYGSAWAAMLILTR